MTTLNQTLALGLVAALAAVALAAPLASAAEPPQCDTIHQMAQIVHSVVGSNPVTSTGDPLFQAAVAALAAAGCEHPFCAAHAILIGGDCAPPAPQASTAVGVFMVDPGSGSTGCGGVVPDAQPASVTFSGTGTPVGALGVALRSECDASVEDGRSGTQVASDVFVEGVASASAGWYEHGTRAARACGVHAALWVPLVAIAHGGSASCPTGDADAILP